MSDENVSQVGQSGDNGTGTPAGQTTSTSQTSEPAVGAIAQPSPVEDRKDWVPPHRLREVTEQRRQIEEAYRQLATQHELARRQVAALAGTSPQSQPDPDDEAATKWIQQKVAAAKLTSEQVDKLLQAVDRVPSLEAFAETFWNREGHSTMQEVFKRAKDTFGGDLSEDQKDIVHSLFVRFVDSNPQNRQRYEVSRDPSLVDDFFKKFSGAVVDPLRRKTTTNIAQTAERGRHLPRGGSGGSGVVVGQGKKTPKDAKEAAKMMHDIMQAG